MEGTDFTPTMQDIATNLAQIMATFMSVIAIVSLIVWLVTGILFGLLARNIAIKKGYGGGAYFALAFFFNFIGLLVVIGLPDRILQAQNQQIIQLLSYNQQQQVQDNPE